MENSEAQGRPRDSSAAVLPEELIVWEVLPRLPEKDLLRCRAVCRAWRRHTSAADFLLAHHRRQPSLPLVSNLEAAFDAVDLRRRPTERQPVLRMTDYCNRDRFKVHASCDGLILLSIPYDGRFYLCNPATRQWIALLRRLHGARVAEMYAHSPTGEYRVLYWEGERRPSESHPAMAAVYYSLTVGSSAWPRCIGQPIASPSVRPFLDIGPMETTSPFYNINEGRSVLLHPCLYWIGLGEDKEMGIVVFDTIKESFRLMHLPSEARQLANNRASWHLLDEIDGTLGINWGSRRETMLKLWVLRNQETEAWSLKYQIEFRVAEISHQIEKPDFQGTIVSEDGDALIFSFTTFQLFHLDCKGKLVQTLDMLSWHTGFRFKESLFRHAFFEGPREGVPSGEPQFFVGL